MLRLVVACVLVAAAAAQTKCCFDKQYSAVLGEAGGTVVNGNAVGLDGTVTLGFDFYLQRQGSKAVMRQPDDSFVTTNTVQDYKNRMTYITDEGGRCTSFRMEASEVMYPPCVPDDARYLGNGTFGYGSETLYIDSWEYNMPGTDVLMKLAVTDTCVPVVEAQYGHINGASTELTYFFTAYHPGIDNLGMLEPPTDCPLYKPQVGPSVGRRAVRGFNF